MPELPDVEGFKKIIDDNCLGKKVVAVNPLVQPGQKVRTIQMDKADFAAAVEGREWKKTERRGKFLIVGLDDGNSLVIHFMLTGELVYHDSRMDERTTNARLLFTFEDKSELIFVDRRNMGRVFWVRDSDFSGAGVLAKLGVEPLSKSFTKSLWEKLVAGNRRGNMNIKDLLCDQKIIAGIGNIYSDRILWEARVRPDRLAKTLSDTEIDRAYEAIPKVLRQGIRQVLAGTVDHDELSRQRRKGGVCPRCGGAMQAIRRGASHSYYCPVCQK